ncbi:MAG TPA: hypothetical protein VKR80_08785 [Candidatus Limnocylindria bacterium]|nr:hypothetical protein [Candidatus Limnocylindria bacterium]
MAADRERLLIRRALYADAQRRGDPLATANAAARLRAHIGDLTALDLATVRASRRNFGQAIRQARSRRVAPPVPPFTGAVPLSGSRRSPLGAVLVVALLALVLASLLTRPSAVNEADGGGGALVAAVSDPVPPVALSRGRVVLPAAAAVEAVADPVATAAPEAAAPTGAAPADDANAAAGTPGPAGSGTAGTGTGTGSGSGSGSGSGIASPAPTASPTPRPTYAACFASIPRGFARLCGFVVDAQTGRGIAGACVSLGPCTDQSTRTDPNGRWAFVLPVGNGTLEWGLEFRMAGYRTATFTQTSRLGFISIPTQRLVAGP